MTTPTIVPDTTDRTRDMGVSEPHWRPPYADALDALRDLEISYGTAVLAEAMNAMRSDTAFYNRSLAANPAQLRSLRALTVSLGEEMAAELLPAFDVAEATVPFPGTYASATAA